MMNEKHQISKKDDITRENRISKFFEQLRSQIKDEGLWHIVSVSALVIISQGTGVVGAIGINLLSNIIDRVIKGEDVPDADIDAMAEKITQADLDQLLSKNEFWKAIAQLARRLDMMGLVIKQGNLDLKNQLFNQYQHHYQSLSEIKDYIWGILRIESAMSDRLERIETQQYLLLQKILIILGDTQMLENENDFKRKITGFSVMTANLPYLLNPLRGRDEDLNKLNHLLAYGQGVIQLIGIGGLGKSRIVAEIALNYPDGAVWHRCSSVTKDYDVVMSLRTHLNLPNDTHLETVLEKIATRKSLIVIDNAEDVSSTHRDGYIGLCNQLANHGVPILFTSREKWDKLPAKSHHLKPFTERDIEILIQMTHDFYAKFGKKFTDDEARQLAKSGRFHPKLIEFAVGQIGGADYPHATIVRRLDELTHAEVQGALYEMITKTLQQMRDVAKYGAKAYDLIHNLTWLQATFPKQAIIALKPPSIVTDDDLDDLEDALATLKRYQFIRSAEKEGRYQLVELVREAIGTNPDVFNAYADFYIQQAEDIFVKLQDNPELWGDQEGGENFDDVVNIKYLGEILIVNADDLGRVLNFLANIRQYIKNRIESQMWYWFEIGLSIIWDLKQYLTPSVYPNYQRLMEIESLISNDLGIIYQMQGDYLKALECYQRSLQICQQLNLKDKHAALYSNIGFTLFSLGDIDESLFYVEKSRSISHEVGDSKGEASALNNIGFAYYRLGKYEEALNHYKLALIIYPALGEENPQLFSNIGLAYHSLGDYVVAFSYYRKGLRIARKKGLKPAEGTILHNIGLIYQEQNRNDKALFYLYKALDLHQQVNNSEMEATTLANIGRVYFEQDLLNEAIKYSQKSLVISESIRFSQGIFVAYGNLSLIYSKLKDLNQAIFYLEKTVEVAYKIKNPELEHLQNLLNKWRNNKDNTDIITDFLKNTYAVLKNIPEKLDEWRSFLDEEKMQILELGDDSQNESQFLDALLAILRGEKPVLPSDNPYADAVNQLLDALGG